MRVYLVRCYTENGIETKLFHDKGLAEVFVELNKKDIVEEKGRQLIEECEMEEQ